MHAKVMNSLDSLADVDFLSSNNGTSEGFRNVCHWKFIRHEKSKIMSRTCYKKWHMKRITRAWKKKKVRALCDDIRNYRRNVNDRTLSMILDNIIEHTAEIEDLDIASEHG